jgi:hypothetical protein
MVFKYAEAFHFVTWPLRNLSSMPCQRGMQNPELTMFACGCYIKQVPRVHPRLAVCYEFCALGVRGLWWGF